MEIFAVDKQWGSYAVTKHRRAGLTLLELLIALVVIVILAALVQVAVRKALGGARGAADLGNMRQIGMAISLFKQDHFDEGRIFLAFDGYQNRYGYGPHSWFYYLRPYLGFELNDRYTSVPAFISPGDPTKGGATSNLSVPELAYARRSYSFSMGTLDTYNRTFTWRNSWLRNPSKLLLFANHRAAEIGTNWIDPNSELYLGAIPTDWFGGETANFAFLDGHVESIKVNDVRPGGSRHGIFVPELDF